MRQRFHYRLHAHHRFLLPNIFGCLPSNIQKVVHHFPVLFHHSLSQFHFLPLSEQTPFVDNVFLSLSSPPSPSIVTAKGSYFLSLKLHPCNLFCPGSYRGFPSPICSGARISSISSISSRGDGLNPNLLYPPLEEEGPPLFPQFSQKLLNKSW
jgi:hypothetical protein